MNLASEEKSVVLQNLQGLLASANLPTKAAASCSSLLAKLQQPVRIGLFGLPDVGKRRVLNTLLQDSVLDLGLTLPTLEMAYGARAQTQAILQDGATVATEGYPSSDIVQMSPMFLQVTSPLRHIVGREFLMIAADPTAEDMAAALSWAATRVDVALFCTRNWSSFERQVWRSAPDTLRNHAILLITGDQAPPGQQPALDPEDGFDTMFKERLDVPSTQHDICKFGGLAQHLQNTIDEASTEDIHAAHLFLHKYGDRISVSPDPQCQDAGSDADTSPEKQVFELVVSEPRQALVTPRPVSNVPEEAVLALTKLFQFVRRSAEGLRHQFPATTLTTEEVEHHLSALDEVFDKLADHAIDQELLEEYWPDLCDVIHDARDLALLMRVEGGLEQVTDASMLLLQLRRDMEMKLAA